MEQKNRNITSNNWEFLKVYTDARISLGRAGSSIPTKELLKFQLAHASARDAVYSKLNTEILQKEIELLNKESILLHSSAMDRFIYLKKPDLGRKLDENSIQILKENSILNPDLCIVIGDGLSARSIQENTIPFLREFFSILDNKYSQSKILIVEQARVGIVDSIGEIISPQICMILIGERPGLSSPNSMGIYFTYQPKLGRKDSERNCISNIRKEGLGYKEAAKKSNFIIEQALNLKLTGVNLKDTMQISKPEDKLQIL
jgi:ethanolamine ammonia-lyase small subunit